MATIAKKVGVEDDAPQVHRIRITLTSKNVKNLEKGEQATGTHTGRFPIALAWQHSPGPTLPALYLLQTAHTDSPNLVC